VKNIIPSKWYTKLSEREKTCITAILFPFNSMTCQQNGTSTNVPRAGSAKTREGTSAAIYLGEHNKKQKQVSYKYVCTGRLFGEGGEGKNSRCIEGEREGRREEREGGEERRESI
jgi:hypothetical protein